MAYTDSEMKLVYYAGCEDCGWSDDRDYEYEDDAYQSASEHELECEERGEDADPRTDREKYQDTLDALANAVMIHNDR